MRVLLLFSSSQLGGAERSLTRMALAAKEPLAFDLATLDGEGPWSNWCRSLGASPIIFGHRRSSDVHGRFGMRALLRLVRLLRTEHYSVLYVIGLRASLLLRLIKPLLRGARLVHGVRWNPDSDSRLDRAFRLIERILGGLIDLYICNSRAAAQTLAASLHISAQKIRVIYNGLAEIPTDPPPLSDRPRQVLTVANLSPRKGYLEYIDQVIVPLSKQMPDVRFVFVGRDEMSGAVQRKIAELGLTGAVACVGFQADVSTYFNAARVFVLPSLWGEGCPTSILEAFAHGLPVVAYAIDGVPELVESGKDGFLIPLGQSKEFARAIVRLLDNESLAEVMGKAGRSKVEQSFTLANCAKQHSSAFMELIEPQASRGM